jgi:putative ubiquitin-RnfH superfamily antitoxin RatB of RatAB toxin-antitoxin module
MIVTVVYAAPKVSHVLTVEVDPGATVAQAIDASGLLAAAPQLDLTLAKVGVWNRATRLDAPVRDGDRIEIYRPLEVDPKEARRIRADIRKRRRGDAEG